jgi:hypothetical protein
MAAAFSHPKSRLRAADPAPLEILQHAAYCLHWGPEPRGFYEAAVTSLLAQRRCTFSQLTVADLIKLSETAASAYADALEKRLLK